jgi:FKBP-type peptidyl-prolyl cis-trans isomerase SlyD
MNIQKHRHVKINYSIKDDSGGIIDSSDTSGPLEYIHGTGSIIDGLENILEGKTAGEKVSSVIPPEKGYGDRDESMMQQMEKEMFSEIEDLQPGIQLQIQDQDVNQIMTVVKIEDEMVTLDGNHPLAGVKINVDAEILEVRDATASELEKVYSAKMGCDGGCSSGCDSC